MINKHDLLLRVKEPVIIASVVVALMWIVNDLSVRIIKPISNKAEINEVSIEQAKVKNNITAQEAAKLIALYDVYKPNATEDTAASEPEGLTKEQQLRQSGLLTEVFIDNNKLTLKAIIQLQQTNKKVALIDVMNIKEQQHELKRFDDQNQVYGYTLEVLNNTQVKLTAQHEQQTQLNPSFSPTTALWLAGVPIIDAVSTISRRIKKGQSPFKPDREHLHHILLRLGLSTRQALVVICICALLFAGFGILVELANIPDIISLIIFLIVTAVYFVCMQRIWRISVRVRQIFGINRKRNKSSD
ncbi:membrane hypothetical protein [Pseudoalteromonas sp. 3J6]|uniref:hypothetical protein n=1 Tax=Pseudoalteromonas sp. 3J6 TaxID=649161 RepID=UPI00176B7997|nr:hypothetical protein [Pseudoalteromonas sp. 3J6]CAD2223401.1 membrane hypothetical protein [Pseudoalteromonas sp. 3J6]